MQTQSYQVLLIVFYHPIKHAPMMKPRSNLAIQNMRRIKSIRLFTTIQNRFTPIADYNKSYNESEPIKERFIQNVVI